MAVALLVEAGVHLLVLFIAHRWLLHVASFTGCLFGHWLLLFYDLSYLRNWLSGLNQFNFFVLVFEATCLLDISHHVKVLTFTQGLWRSGLEQLLFDLAAALGHIFWGAWPIFSFLNLSWHRDNWFPVFVALERPLALVEWFLELLRQLLRPLNLACINPVW